MKDIREKFGEGIGYWMWCLNHVQDEALWEEQAAFIKDGYIAAAKIITKFQIEIDGHKYGLRIVQLDGELPEPDLGINGETCDIVCHKVEQKNMQNAGYKYPVIEEE